MTIRRSSILLTWPLSSGSAVTHSSQSSTSLSASTRHERQSPRSHRYSTITGEGNVGTGNKASCKRVHIWPQPGKGQSCPTPYQILGLQRHEQYSKLRFYELVKIYHPDSHNGSMLTTDELAQSQVRLERYRMLVAAHTILSDPIKRSAYDRFGAGWEGKAEVSHHPSWSQPASHKAQPGPFSHSWTESGRPGSDEKIWQNATWEDWERWHDRKAGREAPAVPLYMSNVSFVALVTALAMIGGSMNYTRAQDAGAYFVEQRDIVHDRAAKDLRRVRQEKHAISSRQDRIDFFARQREATMGLDGFDVEAMRDERANRLLPDKQICRSEEVREGENG